MAARTAAPIGPQMAPPTIAASSTQTTKANMAPLYHRSGMP
jgi:hypothetical protein